MTYRACSDKKSFLYHCYPDGKGPDAELIQMLEKDVVRFFFCIQFSLLRLIKIPMLDLKI